MRGEWCDIKSVFDHVTVREVTVLNRISYWQYSRLKECALKGVFPNNLSLIPASPNISNYNRRMILGMVFHRIMEGVCQEPSNYDLLLLEKVKVLVKDVFYNVENELKSREGGERFSNIERWPEAGSVYDAVVTILKDRKNSSNQNSQKKNSSRVLSEYMLVSENGKVTGKPDLIIQNNDSITVVDYKLCHLDNMTEGVFQSYTHQLLLYANLIEEQLGFYPKKAFLVGKGKSKKEIYLEKEKSLQIRREMETMLEEVNRRIISSVTNYDSLSTPSGSACGNCDAKPWCSSFRRSMRVFETPKYKHIIYGVQTVPFQESRRGGLTLKLKVIISSFGPEDVEVIVTRVIRSWFPHLEDRPGQALIVSNVEGREGDSSASCTFDTRIMAVNTS
ncbi:PD-(D/E)XK nuclease family protein [Pseudomonadota bacterium]